MNEKEKKIFSVKNVRMWKIPKLEKIIIESTGYKNTG